MRFNIGLKAIIVGVLGLVMLLPLAMIDGVTSERVSLKSRTEADIAAAWTGHQQMIGPVLNLPYEQRYTERRWNEQNKAYEEQRLTRWSSLQLIPDQLEIDGDIATELRSRGIYSVPVYRGQFRLAGQFRLSDLKKTAEKIEGFSRWGDATLSLAIGDVRGIGARPVLLWDQHELSFAAGSHIPHLSNGINARLPTIMVGQTVSFKISLELRGSRGLSLVPVASNALARLSADWPHPNFSGRFLPAAHDISDQGFSARWQTSSFSTNIRQALQQCTTGECQLLYSNAFSVGFVQIVDVYQKVKRATKYGVLFVVLTFISFFLAESLLNTSLHPLQYLLCGAALAIFYLLLLSLSEHIAFGAAYLLATVSCVGLITFYLAGALGSPKLGAFYGAAITVLYAKMFAILHSEDYALLMGSLLLFAILVIVMAITRKVNWYSIGSGR